MSGHVLGLTIADAAHAMGVSRRTLERWIASGAVLVFRRGRVVRVPAREIERFRASGTATSIQPAQTDAPRPYRRGRRLAPGERLWD